MDSLTTATSSLRTQTQVNETTNCIEGSIILVKKYSQLIYTNKQIIEVSHLILPRLSNLDLAYSRLF